MQYSKLGSMNKKLCRYPRFVIAALIALAVAAPLFAAGCSSGNKGFWSEIELDEVDLPSVAPGTYRGEYEAGPVKAVVSVEVAGGIIQNIEILEHRNLRGKKAEREIPSRVLRAQSVQVDTVTSATASSMVILKAIEIALAR
jgi:uncharacterized protein with FMN-binding domain